MKHTIEDAQIIQDVVDRLGVIYPDNLVEYDDKFISIRNVEAVDVPNVRQVALDQLIRSRYDANSANLRNMLYTRLLR
ncbi:MAG: hypothetical protein COA43_07955 [Robiginitomaculum sp.]|nr:MAG: hypothetical protein COA43_07955 [Robiginitomaculum sp.]